jgi:hypothetical protein
MQVIMTFHENLQLYPKLHEIYLSEDKIYSNIIFVQNLKCRAIYLEYLNLNPKAIL